MMLLKWQQFQNLVPDFSDVLLKWRNKSFYPRESFLTELENQLQCTAEFVSKALKDLFFVLTVFITTENMSYIHIKQ